MMIAETHTLQIPFFRNDNRLEPMIPINTGLVASHIVRTRPNGHTDCLILQRSEHTAYYPNTWQILMGHIHEGETAADTILREIREETKLQSMELYSLNYICRFYEHVDNTIYLVPLFMTVVPHSARIVLNKDEHQRYQWCTIQEAQRHLFWQQHRRSLIHVQREFLDKTPHEFSRVNGNSSSINNFKQVLAEE